ncbi:MAG: hypothetical protein CMC79_02760 [Flavobacteriaceae bacterium]|nr:hypothetical protein [Flavobacteriaceae bacterium]|tara:strand:- start:25647 stop:25826 length:180 start_codon:yes stop_codon:yes gene_type:complete
MSNSFFYFSLAIGVALGAWGSYLTEQKNRSRQLGFLLGFFFGIIGILIIVLLINKKPRS